MIINYCTLANENLASFRYSMLLPARELQKRGHKIIIGPWPDKSADAVIFSKHLNYEEANYLKECKARGQKTFFHVCDDHFDTKHRDHYLRMIENADVISVTTEPLRESVKVSTGRDSVVIQDPYYYPEQEAKYEPGIIPKVLWYGHQTNVDTLKPILSWLDGFCELIIVSHPMTETFLKRPVVEWSISKVQEEAAKCDLIIIPSLVTSRKRVKSNNRMLEGIRLGRFVISDPLPCYEEFREMMMVDGLKEGFEWLKTQPRDAIVNRIRRAQEYIRDKYSPSVSADIWERILCA